MALTLAKFRMRFDLDWTTARTPGALEAAEATGSLSIIHNIDDGTAAGQANQLFPDRRIIAPGAADDLDMAGTLTNGYGQIITFLTVRAIYIHNISALPTTGIIVAATGSTLMTVPWAVPVASGGLFVMEDLYSGEGVTAGTGDLLRIANADVTNAAEYEVVIIGTST